MQLQSEYTFSNGHSQPRAVISNAFAQMDKMNQGEVTFNQFKKWWFMKQEEDRKDARQKVRLLLSHLAA